MIYLNNLIIKLFLLINNRTKILFKRFIALLLMRIKFKPK